MNAATTPALVIGSGHLAQRVREQFAHAGRAVVGLDGTDLSLVGHAYLVDDSDDANLQTLLTLRARVPGMAITVALFNDDIAAHLSRNGGSLRIVNPAAIAAPAFVAALDTAVVHKPVAATPPAAPAVVPHTRDRLLPLLGAGFMLLVAAATAYFHLAENLAWVDALYFVVVTVATVGYGDINLMNSPVSHKLVDIGLIVSSTIFIWLIFSLTVDRIIKQRVELSLGRKRYAMEGHVVVCGLGRVGRHVVDALLARGEEVLIVEASDSAPAIEHYRTRAAGVYIGDATAPRVLEAVAVRSAKAVFALTNADFANVEIGLNSRAANPAMRVILRVFDPAMAERIRDQLDIHLALSMSAIAAERIVAVE